MKINKLGFLSILALLGILGLIVDHRPLLGFFGFTYYIRYFFITPDELFVQNVRKAASLGFFSGVAATGIAVTVRFLLPALLTNNMALAACYIVSVLCFTIALVVLELREMRGC